MTTTVTLVGNCTREPELKFLPSGIALCEFGVAINSRRKEGDQWVDGDPEFYDITCWRELAENVSESILKGTRVVIVGKLNFRSWEADDGSKRSKISVTADSVGPDLRWATAEVVRNERRDGAVSQSKSAHPAPAAPYDPAEEPFHVDAADWMPGAYGGYPERMFP
jgi:single-strand DNA-binding protein